MTTSETMFFTLKIGSRFFFDHDSRDLVTSSGEFTDYIVKINKGRTIVTVRLSLEDMKELLSDALYYATEWEEMGGEYGGLGKSARATARKVTAALAEAGI